MLLLPDQAKEIMIKDAVQAFPVECCGFFYGTEDENGNRVITEVRVVKNAKEGDKRRRFEIAPLDYLQAEQYAEEKKIPLLGIYHSHPNHPAHPSEHDRVAAQPWFSYIIISVINRKPATIKSWRLNKQSQFEEEEIQLSNIQPAVNNAGETTNNQ